MIKSYDNLYNINWENWVFFNYRGDQFIALWPFLTRGGVASNMYTVLWNIHTFPLLPTRVISLWKTPQKLWQALTAKSNRVTVPSPLLPW